MEVTSLYDLSNTNEHFRSKLQKGELSLFSASLITSRKHHFDFLSENQNLKEIYVTWAWAKIALWFNIV